MIHNHLDIEQEENMHKNKEFGKMQYYFIIKTLTKLEIEGKCLNLEKDIYENI